MLYFALPNVFVLGVFLSFFVTSTSEASFSDVSNPIFSITLNSQDFSSFALTLQDLLKRPQELHTSAPL